MRTILKVLSIFLTIFIFGSSTSIIHAQPGNDNQSSATTITALDGSCNTYTTENATADGPTSCYALNENVWFKFTGSTNEFIKITVDPDGAQSMKYPIIALWEDDGIGGITLIDCESWGTATGNLVLSSTNISQGTTYFISVDNHTIYDGTFNLCLSDQFGYDYYQGAKNITTYFDICPSPFTYSTTGASGDQSKPACWANGPNNNRWFKFTATQTHFAKVTVTPGSMKYPYLAMWEDDGSGNLSVIACATFTEGKDPISVSKSGLVQGQTYYISVDNAAGNYDGTFNLCLDSGPENDDIVDAFDVSSLIGSCSNPGEYTTVNANPDGPSNSCGGINNNVWYKFQAPSIGFIKASLSAGSINYPKLTLWDSDGMGGLTEITCNSGVYSSAEIQVNYLGLTPGDYYYISVDNGSGPNQQGSFTLCLSDNLGYNYYQGAEVLSDVDDYCSTGHAYTTEFANTDQSSSSCLPSGPYNNVWFKFTAVESDITIDVDVSSLKRSNVALWDASLNEVDCEYPGGYNVDVHMETSGLIPGNIYYISVDNGNQNTDPGSFDLCVDNVAAPLPIKLMSFNATCLDGKVRLAWATSSEINNDFFSLERSIDGSNWKTIATIDGAGNNNGIKNYSYTDDPYGILNSVNSYYYRLKQTDIDGKFTYSDIELINCGNDRQVQYVQIVPNPNNGNFIVNGLQDNSEVIILDTRGEVVYKTTTLTNTAQVQLNDAAAGIYFLLVNSDKGTISKKIVIGR